MLLVSPPNQRIVVRIQIQWGQAYVCWQFKSGFHKMCFCHVIPCACVYKCYCSRDLYVSQIYSNTKISLIVFVSCILGRALLRFITSRKLELCWIGPRIRFVRSHCSFLGRWVAPQIVHGVRPDVRITGPEFLMKHLASLKFMWKCWTRILALHGNHGTLQLSQCLVFRQTNHSSASLPF